MGARDLLSQIRKFASWEISGLANPVFLTVLSSVFFFLIPFGASTHRLIYIQNETDPLFVAASDLLIGTANAAVTQLYVPLILAVSFSAVNTFTKEFDSGLAKFYLSLPISRLAILAGKFVAIFSTLYLVEIFACLSYVYVMEPSNFLAYLGDTNSVALLLYYLFCELFFILGVTTYVCILSPKSWAAVVLSTFSLYAFKIVEGLQPQLKWNLPPYVFTFKRSFGDTLILGLLFLSISAALLLMSAYLFLRRVEIS